MVLFLRIANIFPFSPKNLLRLCSWNKLFVLVTSDYLAIFLYNKIVKSDSYTLEIVACTRSNVQEEFIFSYKRLNDSF